MAGRFAAEAIHKENPFLYDERWKKNLYSSPLFLETF